MDLIKLHFDALGHLTHPEEQVALLQALQHTQQPVTDLWIFSHGWKNDEQAADEMYTRWTQLFHDQQKDLTRNPLLVGIYWPSMLTLEPVFPSLVATPHTLVAHVQKQSFVATCQAMFNPDGTRARALVERDFAFLYECMLNPLPSDAELQSCVQRLSRYQTKDIHAEAFESRSILDSPDSLFAYLKDEVARAAASLEKAVQVSPLFTALQAFTFWTMKARAALVGQQGLAASLYAVKQASPAVRIHLLGHSFGAKLVSSAVFALPQMGMPVQQPLVDDLFLLQGAFSQFSFTEKIPLTPVSTGYYATLIEKHLVAHPLVAFYSSYDLANKNCYPLGMLLAGPGITYEVVAATSVVSTDRFGALGANGAQDILGTQTISLLPSEAVYDVAGLLKSPCVNVDAQNVINHCSDQLFVGAHDDIFHPEIFHLLLSIADYQASQT